MTRNTRWLVGALAAALSIGPAAAQAAGSSDEGSATYGRSGTEAPSETHGQPQQTQAGTASGTSESPDPNADNATSTSAGGPSAESPTTSAQPGASSKSSKMSAAEKASASRTLAKLHAGNQMEIQAGTWMKEHASNDRVKDFAKKMVDDHTKLDKDGTSFAKDHGIDLTSSTATSAQHAEMSHGKAQLDEIKGMQGAQADRAYMRMMVKDHTKDVQEVRSAQKRAEGAHEKDLASLLDKAGSKMEEHLQDAQKISHDLSSRQARTPSSSQ